MEDGDRGKAMGDGKEREEEREKKERKSETP